MLKGLVVVHCLRKYILPIIIHVRTKYVGEPGEIQLLKIFEREKGKIRGQLGKL